MKIAARLTLPASMLVLGCLALLAASTATLAADPATAGLAGYANFQTLAERVKKLDEHPRVEVRSIGKSLEGRDLYVVVIGSKDAGQKDAAEKPDDRPAIVVMGNVTASHLLGGDLALAMCDDLLARVDNDEKIAALLDQYTLYVMPRPDPDGSEKCFDEPRHDVKGNARRTDDDRDFATGEDPADDLNGDGLISWMRVEDPTGKWIEHPADSHLMVEADRSKGEIGRYSVYPEGKDDDQDGSLNEDASAGVSLDQNFPHRYQAFANLTGEHAASEPETKAIIDFLYDHKNVVAVLTLGTDDNVFHPWKANQQAESQRIAQHIHSADAPLQEFLGGELKKLHGGNDCPSREPTAGSFSQWVYFHYGRWSLVSRGWWVPPMPAKPAAGDMASAEPAKQPEQPASTQPVATSADVATAGTENLKPADEPKPKPDGDKKPETTPPAKLAKKGSDDNRLETERNEMRYLASRGIATSTDWKTVEHPDFPGKKVEVGGRIPLATVVPPIEDLKPLATKHVDFLKLMPTVLPEVKLGEVKAENLGGGVVRIAATVVNSGRLPTTSRMGEITRQHQQLQLELLLPQETKFLQGSMRRGVGRVEGSGGNKTITWLVRFDKEVPSKIGMNLFAPTLPTVSVEVPVTPAVGAAPTEPAVLPASEAK